MTCAECREWIIDTADDANARVSEHVRGCAACAEELAFVRGVSAAMRRLPLRDPGPSFDARVLQRWNAESRALVVAPFGWMRRFAVGYAAVWSAVAAGLLVWMTAAGGASRVVSLLADLVGPASARCMSATRSVVDVLASIAIAADIVSTLARVLQPATLALIRALHTPQSLALLLVCGTAVALVIQSNNRRRTHHVHAFI